MDAPIRSSAHASALRVVVCGGDLTGEWMRRPPRRHLGAARRNGTGEPRPPPSAPRARPRRRRPWKRREAPPWRATRPLPAAGSCARGSPALQQQLASTRGRRQSAQGRHGDGARPARGVGRRREKVDRGWRGREDARDGAVGPAVRYLCRLRTSVC
jgi:hypothetical protein